MSETLLIIRPGAIGDTLLAFPILRTLKKQKQARITFVSNPAVLPLASAFELADVVFDYGALVWSELFSPSGIRSPLLLDILQQTNSVICWLRDADGIVEHNLRQAGITRIRIAPGRPAETSNMHIVEYLARTLGMMLTNDVLQTMPRTDDEGIQLLEQGHPTNISSNSVRTVAIHPGSGSAAKCWPIEHFASVITKLWQHHIPVLLLAGPADTERLDTLLALIGVPPASSLLEIMTDAPLLAVATRLKNCSAYLGNDSGITHLAAMLGVPTLALFGPSNPNVWRPVGTHVQVLYNSKLESIRVETVLDILTTIVNEKYKNG